jgi:FkbM family methyltransferase
MHKIGEFWIPDIDAAPGRNLERSQIGFGEKQGIQIAHLYRALELVPGRALAVDGGANVGAWSRVMAQHFAAVHSFEPNPDAHACLARNVADWNIGDVVTTHGQGISDRHEFVSIGTREGARTVTGKIVGKGNIECVTIDSLNLPACSFLKLDVEGYEAQALTGARETIRKYQPWIMIENRPARFGFLRRASRPERILRDHGYSVVEKIGDDQLDWLFRPRGG